MSAPCAICGKPVIAEYKPFCSKRCANIDLNKWFTGNYAVAAVENDDDLPDEELPEEIEH